MGTLLKNSGFEVSMHASGESAARALAEAGEVSLVCASLVTTDISGIELCRKIRLTGGRRDLPFILVTSKEDTRSSEDALNAGVTDVFFKSDLQHLQTYLAEMGVRSAREKRLDATVFYAEDSLVMSNLVIGWLEPLGLRVRHFLAGEPLLQAMETEPCDLVLTDFLLEGKISGLAVVREIRNTLRSRVPVLVISGFEDQPRRVEILRSGANDFITKPVLQEELIARIQTLVMNKKLLDELEAQQDRLLELAMTDSLTGLYNRHSLSDIAPKLMSGAQRHGHPLSLVMLDLDNFKFINDNFGHQAGDDVLCKVGQLLRESCREGDYSSRFGGEEFLIILPHCDSRDAQARAEQLRRALAELRPAGMEVSASFGVATLKAGDGADFDLFLKRADQALYRAKSNGKNQVSLA